MSDPTSPKDRNQVRRRLAIAVLPRDVETISRQSQHSHYTLKWITFRVIDDPPRALLL